MVCLCHPNICSIGRLSADGRLVVFYQIPKPANILEDVMPIAVWAPLGNEITFASHVNPEIGDGLFRDCFVFIGIFRQGYSMWDIDFVLESAGDPLEGSTLGRSIAGHT